MTSHADCTHPKTKAARAKCRRLKAEVATLLKNHEVENQINHDTYIAPFEAQEEARKNWENEQIKFCEAHIASAEENADDTSVEEGFEPHSKRWYDIAISTLHHARDNADEVFDLSDPEKGQYIPIYDRPFWIDQMRYGDQGRASKLMLVNREGSRSWVMVEDLIAGNFKLTPLGRAKEHHEAYSRYVDDGIASTDGYYAPIDFEAWVSIFGKSLDTPLTHW